ncbi:MAG: sigma-54-dependent Fis family transcriptional regulator [Gemmatimonadaceae bacterium]|nr:sigma-54-dependent Fis family transcriptional regulator [Gemmatimonadaceae bacterium]
MTDRATPFGSVSSESSGLDALFLRSEVPSVQEAVARLRAFALADDPILLEGETGTGKSHLAIAAHEFSPRRRGPRFDVSLSGLDHDLMHSHLFGHRKGAFTGATSNHDGLFVQAQGGSLFMDEIGHAQPPLQRALLDVVENRRVLPLGSKQYVPMECRMLSATNVPLATLVANGQFLDDLRYRVSPFVVRLPSLRERQQDLPDIFRWFMQRRAALSYARRPAPALHPDAARVVAEYTWPGNLREVAGVVARLLTLHREASELSAEVVTEEIAASGSVARTAERPMVPPRPPSGAATDDEIIAALAACGGKRDVAASMLGIGRSTLFRRLKALRSKQSA